ncbi:MAG: gamma-carotene 1'-hydroxylase CruF [Geitlerinemataceae cyanobacterium]
MKQSQIAERASLLAHIFSMAFGLAGLLFVLPHPEFIARLSPAGMTLFSLGMGQGGVAYIILGAIALSLFACRTMGWRTWLAFAVPTLALSLSSELLGTSTGFPFGAYSYLSGLGYKIAGLVPFTIPLSWFYMGLSCYLLARAGMEATGTALWVRRLGAIALGAVLLTAWDLVLDPAMSQTSFPFWQFQEAGEFFGMPYRNLTGWLGTGAVFMTVATLLRPASEFVLPRKHLGLPLVVYLINFAFGAIITLVSLDSGFVVPTLLSIALGVLPAILCWWVAQLPEDEIDSQRQQAIESLSDISATPLETSVK